MRISLLLFLVVLVVSQKTLGDEVKQCFSQGKQFFALAREAV
jgi:hypothetical protein